MSLTRDEVFWLYKTIIGRIPESEEAYELHMAAHPNFENARLVFMNSKEFQDQIFPPVFYKPKKSRAEDLQRPISLALATIVKDEERQIELMLRSCLPIVSFVVVVDTGSSDDTKKIAESVLKREGVPHIIRDEPFINFSQARNQALSLVPETIEWTLMLDADEHIVPEDFHLFSHLMSHDCDAWALPRYSFCDRDKLRPVQTYPDHQRRLIRNRAETPVRFSGDVHENIVAPFVIEHAPANTTRFAGSEGGPHIHHMGGVGVSDEQIRKKLDFYIKLASQQKTDI